MVLLITMTSRTFTRVALAIARKSSLTCGQGQIKLISSFRASDLTIRAGLLRNPIWSYSFCRRIHEDKHELYEKTGQAIEELRHYSDAGGEEEGEMVQSYMRQQGENRMKANKVKVKFARKHSLVTADAINLMENLYRDYPGLVELDANQILAFLMSMSKYGIDVERAAEILLIYPRAISIPEMKIEACIRALRGVGFSEKQRKSAVRRAPQLLEISPKKITKQYSFLKTYFSTEETHEVLGTSLEIFMEPEATVRKKLDYLIKDMSHETKHICVCKVLEYPLKHMKTRHEFLIRSGFFKPIPYRKMIKIMERDYKDKNKARDKYFKPLELVCYKDVDFLKVCTKSQLTLNELAAFEELYEAEMAAQEEIDEEDFEEGESFDDFEDDGRNDAVSLIKNTSSVGFFNDAEAKNCYF